MTVVITTVNFRGNDYTPENYHSDVYSWGDQLHWTRQMTEADFTVYGDNASISNSCNEVSIKTSIGNPDNFVIVDSKEDNYGNSYVNYYFFERGVYTITADTGNFSVIGEFTIIAKITNNFNDFSINIDKSMLDNYSELLQIVVSNSSAKKIIDENVTMLQAATNTIVFEKELKKYKRFYNSYNHFIEMIEPSIFQDEWANKV